MTDKKYICKFIKIIGAVLSSFSQPGYWTGGWFSIRILWFGRMELDHPENKFECI
jgi:hypothetical protein